MAGLNFEVNLPGEDVTVLSSTATTDPYSGSEAVDEDWASPTQRTVTTIAPLEPFRLQPAGEPVQDARNALTRGWVVYLPPGDPITAKDRVNVRGVVYPVQGQPADWGVGVVVNAFSTEG